MADKNPLTPEEVTELFSEIDASGVLDPTLAKKRTERMREKEAAAKRGDKAALVRSIDIHDVDVRKLRITPGRFSA